MAYETESPFSTGVANNTSATANTLTSGVQMTGALGSSSDLDYFAIATAGASLINLNFVTGLVSATDHWQIRLLDSNGDYVRTLASSVSGSPLVNGGSQTGSTLAVDGLTALPAIGSRFNLVTSSADTTIYTVTSATALSAGATTLTLNNALPATAPADNAVLAFDPAQTLVAAAANLTAQVSAAGTYYVEVLLADGQNASWDSSDYRLTATVLPTTESTSENGGATFDAGKAAAVNDNNRLLAGAAMTGNLTSATDVDYWVFTTAAASDFTVAFAAASGDATTPEWKIDVTEWSGATLPSNAGALSAGTAASVSIDDANYPTAKTFVVKVSATSSSVYDTGNYTLKVSGTGLDLNDTPVLSDGTVSSTSPNVQFGSKVRTMAVGTADDGTGVALNTLFSVTDPDASQTVANYRVSLTRATGAENANTLAYIRVGATDYGFGSGDSASGNVRLTAAQMATATFYAGTVAGDLNLDIQAYDSTVQFLSDGSVNDSVGDSSSGTSALLHQTLHLVSGSFGVTVGTPTATTLSEHLTPASGAPHAATFTLVLGALPSADVKVYLTDVNDEVDAFKVGGATSSLVTFTTANWNVAQTVTVTATNDGVTEGASQTAGVSFQVVSTDGSYDGYAVAPLAFTVADNAAPVLATPTATTGSLSFTDTAATDSFATAAGGTLAATDANGDTPVYGIFAGTTSGDGLSVSKTGTYGTLVVTKASGAWTYTPNATAINALTANTTDAFTVTASDGNSNGSATITVNLTAANDTPALATPTAVAYTDTAADDTFGNTTGTLAGSDADSGQTLTYGISGTVTDNGTTVSQTGTYGTLTVTKAGGAYTFAPSDAAIEGVKTAVSENFTVTVSDGVVATASSATLAVNITGANDSATFGGTSTGSVTEDGTATATGTMTFTDRDTADTAGAITAQTDTAGTYGSFSIGTNGAWTYTLNNSASAVQNLNAGDAPTDVFTVAANGSSQSVTITVNGANEAGTTPPTLVAPAATSGSLSYTDTAADNTFSSAGGTLSVSSWGGAATSGSFGISGGTVASGTSTKVGTYGTLTVNTTTGVWAFAPSDAGIEGIKANTTEVFTVTANNGTATDTDTITINLTGADDTTSVSGTTGSATESANSTTAATVTGTLVVSDRDIADAAVITAQTATAGTYGSFTIAAGGAWTYTLDNADTDTQRLVAADSVTDSFNVDVGGGNTRAVRITITGINDAPTLSNTSISYNNTTSTSETFNNTTGTLPGADVDAGQTLTYGLTGGAVNAGVSTKAGTYGTLSVNTTTGAYTYDPNDAAINAQSGSVTDSFDVTLSDGVASTATAATFVASIASGKTVGVLAYAWKSHTLLDGVSVGFTGVTAQSTASGGAASFSNVNATTLDLTATLAADSNTSGAVDLIDAIAILKMIVGLDVNGAGKALSPYQAIAADYDGDATVGLVDAIGVLKHVVGLTAPNPAWVFLNEANANVPALASGLTGKSPPTLSADVTSATSVGLVGVLRGDVDGNWTAPQGSLDLDTTQASYFTNLVSTLNAAHPGTTFDAAQWGIYPA